MVGAVVVPIVSLSSVSGVAGLRNIVLVGWYHPINDFSVSILIFVEANASFMSVVQDVCFFPGKNTLRE